jgi:hypothetical protein
MNSLFQVNSLFYAISVKDSNCGVVTAEIFIGPNCDILVVLVTSIVVRAAGKGVSSISSARLIFQEDIVLFSLR